MMRREDRLAQERALEQVLSCRSDSDSSFAWESVKPDATLGLNVLWAAIRNERRALHARELCGGVLAGEGHTVASAHGVANQDELVQTNCRAETF